MAVSRTFLAVSVLVASLMSGQRHEVGVQGGLTNLVGDIGRTGYILQKPFGDISTYGLPVYAGVIYRMNFNPYQTLRFNVGYSNIQFSDAYAKEAYRKQRRGSNGNYLAGTNTVYNADVQFEYNFFPVNNEQKGMLSPYIFGGIGGIAFSNRRVTIHTDLIDSGISPIETELYTDVKASIPFGAGLKYKFNYNWALFGEFKFRYTTTDNIDYSKIAAKNVRMVDVNNKGIKESNLTPEQISYRNAFIEAQHIGNINSKDWINAVTIGLSYSFGRPPCYCD